MKKKSKANRINVVTLGCSKNVVDSEHVMAQLEAAGYEVVFDSNDNDAATVVINTCGFIGDAKEESINTILQFVQAKSEGLIDRLFVIGCLSERYADELRAEIPEVDDYFGARDFRGIVERLAGAWRPELATARHLTTPAHYAYLKISEGCNWRCAYCAIPLIRGGFRSRSMESVLGEIRALAEEMYKLVYAVAPTLFGHSGPACVDGACTEGKMSCGRGRRSNGDPTGKRVLCYHFAIFPWRTSRPLRRAVPSSTTICASTASPICICGAAITARRSALRTGSRSCG